ncbi:MAG: hypothetical protein IKH04_12895 [Kiritimatiellae bacterium]|nr:hypothetical protein [Kiritimatiellia bacterium]
MERWDVKIGADGSVDAAAVVDEIRRRAAERLKNGEYDLETLVRAERFNLSALKDNPEFFNGYLSGIHRVTQVDIGDWEIREKHSGLVGKLLIRLKRTIRSLLRFYTFRLWSQQNRANAIFHSSLSLLAERESEDLAKANARIAELERRLAALEKAGRA